MLLYIEILHWNLGITVKIWTQLLPVLASKNWNSVSTVDSRRFLWRTGITAAVGVSQIEVERHSIFCTFQKKLILTSSLVRNSSCWLLLWRISHSYYWDFIRTAGTGYLAKLWWIRIINFPFVLFFIRSFQEVLLMKIILERNWYKNELYIWKETKI